MAGCGRGGRGGDGAEAEAGEEGTEDREDKTVAGGPMNQPIWTNENAGVKCWVEARPNERGGMFRILVTTPDKSDPGNGYPYEQEADAVEVAGQTFRAIEAMYNKVETRL
jgi:hypothetical protein